MSSDRSRTSSLAVALRFKSRTYQILDTPDPAVQFVSTKEEDDVDDEEADEAEEDED